MVEDPKRLFLGKKHQQKGCGQIDLKTGHLFAVVSTQASTVPDTYVSGNGDESGLLSDRCSRAVTSRNSSSVGREGMSAG